MPQRAKQWILFQKRNEQIFTFIELGTKGPPLTRGRYETLDYILTNDKWKSSITNIENDVEHCIETNHVPIVAEINLRVKSREKEEKKEDGVKRYKESQIEQKIEYNNKLKNMKGKNMTEKNKW